MEYRNLGRSGLQVSTITLGTMTFGGKGGFGSIGSTQVDEAKRLVAACIDAGVNLFDTADMYSQGTSEEILGQVLAGRDDVLVATKVRFPMGEGPNDTGLSRHHVISGAEASLRRLGRDHIDLYQIHEWDGITPVEETLEALELLQRQGKVRAVGVSNYAGWQLLKALGTAERLHLPRFTSEQIYYSLIGREAEWELIPAALDQNLGVLVWSPLAGGLLSGKYRRDREDPAGTRRANGWTEPPVPEWGPVYDVIDVLVEIADGRGVSGAQVALAWLLGRPGVTSLVIGARTEAHLQDNLVAASLELTEDERSRLDAASQRPLPYPHWHQHAAAGDRRGPAERSLHSQYPD